MNRVKLAIPALCLVPMMALAGVIDRRLPDLDGCVFEAIEDLPGNKDFRVAKYRCADGQMREVIVEITETATYEDICRVNSYPWCPKEVTSGERKSGEA